MQTINTKPLTPAQLRFVAAFVKFDNLSKAIRIAYPEQSQAWSAKYQHLKGARLMENDRINAEIANRKSIMEANANLAAQRIQTIITEGKEHNALEASKFAIEQVDGRAVQTAHVKSEHVSVIYDLSGGAGGEIPAEVLAQLEE